MDDYIVSQVLNSDRIVWYNKLTGVEIVIDGGEVRCKLADRIVFQLEVISEQAIRLLESFMRDSGNYELTEVEVFPAQSVAGADFLMSYRFTADSDSTKYDSTYFDVYFNHHELPGRPFWFWPHKFTIGFK